MSQKTGETIICPNCGFHATENYCARCGQENHLHKETFWGLVTHFIGHYFHYDSKFWKTLKALWFSPGKLTRAYWDKQRMRYLPPISLYIFVSAVFFIVFLSRGEEAKHAAGISAVSGQIDSLDDGAAIPPVPGNVEYNYELDDSSKLVGYLERKADIIEKKHGKSINEYITESVKHNLPKVFFFMIPVMGLLLKLLFARRKQQLFVHHAIFSLHIHSFVFSIYTLYVLTPFVGYWLNLTMLLICAWYFIIAMKRVYEVSYARSVLNLVVTFIGYIIFLLLAIAVTFAIVILLA
jgi:hypothetical protein